MRLTLCALTGPTDARRPTFCFAKGAGAGGGGGGGAGGDALGDGGRHRGGGSGGGGGEIQRSNFCLINAYLCLTLSNLFTGN